MLFLFMLVSCSISSILLAVPTHCKWVKYDIVYSTILFISCFSSSILLKGRLHWALFIVTCCSTFRYMIFRNAGLHWSFMQFFYVIVDSVYIVRGVVHTINIEQIWLMDHINRFDLEWITYLWKTMRLIFCLKLALKITRFLALLQNLQLLEIEKKSQSAIQHPGKKLLEKLSNKLLEKLLSVNAPFQFLSFVFHVLYCLCFLFNMIL